MKRILWLGVLILLAFALRLYRLDVQALRGDESITLTNAEQSIGWIIAHVGGSDPNPPLMHLSAHLWMGLVGRSEFALRFYALFFGVLMIPLIYRFGKTLARIEMWQTCRLPGAVGLICAALVAVNPFQIWHAQDLRNYTLWPLLSLGAVWFFIRWLDEERWSLWGGYVLLELLSLYTHYYEPFVVLFQNLFFLAGWRRNRPFLGRWILAQALVGGLYLPWLLFGTSMPLQYDPNATTPTLLDVFKDCIAIFMLGETMPQTITAWLFPALLVALVGGFIIAFRKERRLFLLLTLYVLVPSLCNFVVAQWKPLFRARYLSAIAPAYYLVFACGLAALWVARRRWLRFAFVPIALLYLGLAAYSLDNYYHDPHYAKSRPWRELADHLRRELREEDIVIWNYPDPTYKYYFPGAESIVLPIGYPLDWEATENELARLVANYERIWFIPQRAENWDKDGQVESWLDRYCRQISAKTVADFPVYLYTTSQVFLAEMEGVGANLGGKVELLGYNLEPRSVRPRGALRLTLYWRALTEIDTSYTVFTHLLGPDGSIRGQKDSLPTDGAYPTTEWQIGEIIVDTYVITVAPDAPAGSYTLAVGLYDATSGQRLPTPDEADRVVLTQEITVE